jgi:hypothetical protein
VFHEGKPILELEKMQTLTEPPGRKSKRAAERRTKA